ncbi:sigma-70 family RNA polymerase sigma factor [Planctomycetales bacterium ZRK34]|nr:sigma-70 family RNA polymerase sigma factor [Planctomycetales bacterium ZRK34]
MAIEQDTIVRVLVKDRARLLAYIWAIVSDVHVAEDVLSEVTVLAVKKREQIADEAHLAGWLRIAARTEALKALRTDRSRPTPMSDQLIDLLDAEWATRDAQSSNDLADALQICMQRLSPRARQLVKLRYAEGLSGAVLAEKLNQRIKSIYVAISRVHRALGDCIRAHVARESR